MKKKIFYLIFKSYLIGFGVSLGIVTASIFAISLPSPFFGTGVDEWITGDYLGADQLNNNFNAIKTAFESIPEWQKGGPSDEDAELLTGRIKDKTGFIMPVGTVIAYGGSSEPEGWLFCDGHSVSATTYDDLFAIIGYNFGGSGDTFYLPDLKQRFPLGKAISGTGNTLGETGGSINHIHGAGSYQSPAHRHKMNFVVRWGVGGLWTHIISADARDDWTGLGFHVPVAHDGPYWTGGGAHPSHDTNEGGGSVAGNSSSSNPPFIALNYIIKY
jgi:microcystin-dependent protein